MRPSWRTRAELCAVSACHGRAPPHSGVGQGVEDPKRPPARIMSHATRVVSRDAEEGVIFDRRRDSAGPGAVAVEGGWADPVVRGDGAESRPAATQPRWPRDPGACRWHRGASADHQPRNGPARFGGPVLVLAGLGGVEVLLPGSLVDDHPQQVSKPFFLLSAPRGRIAFALELPAASLVPLRVERLPVGSEVRQIISPADSGGSARRRMPSAPLRSPSTASGQESVGSFSPPQQGAAAASRSATLSFEYLAGSQVSTIDPTIARGPRRAPGRASGRRHPSGSPPPPHAHPLRTPSPAFRRSPGCARCPLR